MLKKIFLCLLIFIFILIILFLLTSFISLKTFDGKFYTKNEWTYYYIITPGVIKSAPRLSDTVNYYAKGDDDYGYEINSVTWENVADVPAAQKKIEQFFIDKGFTERHGGKVWSVYWSNILVTPDTCPSEQYSTVWGHNSISIELISVSRGC